MKRLTSIFARLSALVPAVVVLALATVARAADEYEPVTGAQTRTDPNPYIVAAYGFIWAAVVVYVVMVARGLGRARSEIDELRRRVDSGGQ